VKDIIVGRAAKADLVLDHPEVSRCHCRIFRENEIWFVEDLESRLGVSRLASLFYVLQKSEPQVLPDFEPPSPAETQAESDSLPEQHALPCQRLQRFGKSPFNDSRKLVPVVHRLSIFVNCSPG